MYSVGFKKKALRSQRLFEGKGSSKTKALRWQRQRPFEGKGESSSKPKAKDFGMQRPLGGKAPWRARHFEGQRPFEGKGESSSKAKTVRSQSLRPFEDKSRSKAKCGFIYTTVLLSRSYLPTITRVLVRLGSRMLH